MKGYHGKKVRYNKKNDVADEINRKLNAKKKQSAPTKKERKVSTEKSLTQHERVMLGRANKLGMTLELYQARYPKGYSE